MHAHRVHVLDRADDDHGVGRVPHHLELELLPPLHRALDEHLPDRARSQRRLHRRRVLVAVVDHRRPRPPEGERGAQDRGESNHVGSLVGPSQRGHRNGWQHRQAGPPHRLPEALPVLRGSNRLHRCAEQLDAEPRQRAGGRELHRHVERRLAPQRREERVTTLPLQDRGHDLFRDGLDVGRVRALGIGHDRRGVGVHQHDPQPFFAQGLDTLDAGVVKLARLPDPDRPGAEDAHGSHVVPARHQA